MTFFVDRSLGRRAVPSALRQAGFDVVVHDDVFAADTDDEIWLREAGVKGWIVLVKDDRIRYRPRERTRWKPRGYRRSPLRRQT